ncbi:hypothetical protein HPSS1190_07726, partial [Helicobacter pylori SS1_190]
FVCIGFLDLISCLLDFNRLWFLFVVFDFLLCLFLCFNVWFFALQLKLVFSCLLL